MRKLAAAAGVVFTIGLAGGCEPAGPGAAGAAGKPATPAASAAGASASQPDGGDTPAGVAPAQKDTPEAGRDREGQRHARDRGERQQ